MITFHKLLNVLKVEVPECLITEDEANAMNSYDMVLVRKLLNDKRLGRDVILYIFELLVEIVKGQFYRVVVMKELSLCVQRDEYTITQHVTLEDQAWEHRGVLVTFIRWNTDCMDRESLKLLLSNGGTVAVKMRDTAKKTSKRNKTLVYRPQPPVSYEGGDTVEDYVQEVMSTVARCAATMPTPERIATIRHQVSLEDAVFEIVGFFEGGNLFY